MSDDTVLVPVKIEALIVDKNTSGKTAWKDFSLDYDGVNMRMGVELEVGELKELKKGLCEEGIHLHWALPAALTNGIHINKQMVFPAVPNRWLIVRTHLAAGKPVIKNWIVESDSTLNGKSPWMIQKSDGSFETTCIGRETASNTWVESERLAIPLTAVGPGNPTFAAIYQSCRNVFGFHDKLDGIAKGTPYTFSYLVTGWYSDRAIDPLNSAPEEIKDNLKKKWLVNAASRFPSAIFCHGYIHTVKWDSRTDYSLPHAGKLVDVGAGYTAVDAKSAQIARQTGAAEKLVSAYFYDVLKNIEGVAEIESQVGDRSFSSVESGTLWEIRRKENKKNDKETDTNEFPDANKCPGLADLYSKLNDEQRKHDMLIAEKTSLLMEFRALCDKLIKDDREKGKPYSGLLTEKRGHLKKEINDITEQIATAQKKLKEYKTDIGNLPFFKEAQNERDPQPEFELLKLKTPRFWKPNDPVMLFTGPGVVKSGKYKTAGNADKLVCRVPAEVISDILLYDDSAIDEKKIAPESINLALNQTGSLTAERIGLIYKLYREAILLDPQWAREWALKYYGAVKGQNELAEKFGKHLTDILSGDIDNTKMSVRGLLYGGATLISEPVKNKKTLKAFYDELGILTWKHPWTPVNMIWYGQWMPAYEDNNKQLVFSAQKWAWEGKKYKYTGARPDGNIAIEYSGKAILTDGINGIIDSRLPGRDMGHNISQALASFSDALLMRRQAIQLPLLKKNESRQLVRDTGFDNYLTTDSYFFPDTGSPDKANSFFPLRAGHLRVTRLWITDVFGQVQKVIDPEKSFVRSGDMHVASDIATKTDGSLLTLAPRVIQPSRLSFRWINASSTSFEESTSDPDTSPVCGWLMPDFLNDTLDVFDASGKSCGSLRTGINKRLEWHAVRGAVSAIPERDISNKFLLGFVKGLLSDRNAAPGLFRDLFDLCTDTARYIHSPASNHMPGIASLVGQPLALLRASLQLELLGLPAQPQGWRNGFDPTTKKVPTGLSGIEFPVALGDMRNSKDGLVGYFTDKTGFERMYTVPGSQKKENLYFISEEIKLSFSHNEGATGVTLLMDIRGGVQADCGILPSKLIDLPRRFVDNGIRNMELNLLVAPFLSSPADPDIPVSNEPGNNWILSRKIANEWTDKPVGSQKALEVNAINNQAIQEGYLTLKKETDDNK